jgi:hypothetical protein
MAGSDGNMVRQHGASVITGMVAKSSAKAAGATAAEQPFTSEAIAALLLAAVRPFVKAQRSAVETLSAARGASNRAALLFAVAAEWKAARPPAEVAGHNSAAAAKVAVQRCAAAVTLAGAGLAAAVAPAAASAAVAAPAAVVGPVAAAPAAAAVGRAEAAAADDK